MGQVAKTLRERTELPQEAIAALEILTSNWSLLADFALSDLVLWAPTWNDGGMTAVAQIRPTTAPTTLGQDVVGTFAPRGRFHYLDRAEALGQATIVREILEPLSPVGVEAIPVKWNEQVIAVIARHCSGAPRVAGRLEQVYLESADSIFAMISRGQAWSSDSVNELGRWELPRAGDGVIRLDETGKVNFASPNAVSSFRKMGLAIDLMEQGFFEITKRMNVAAAGMSQPLIKLSHGGTTGMADLVGDGATLMLASHYLAPSVLPATKDHCTIIIVKDVTDLREHQKELLSKDAIIKEINHRVKNNLQMVTSVLRLQARRAGNPAVTEALGDAQARIEVIAAIHDSLSREGATHVDFDALVGSLLGLIRNDGVKLESIVHGRFGTLNSRVATPLAMAVSELIHNIVEHSGATEILVTAKRDKGHLLTTVSDNGVGIVRSEVPLTQLANCGLGLTIVSDLVYSELAGQVTIGPVPTREPGKMGTRVMIRIPVARREAGS
ncbi:MAG: sensor histidine kinase [Candidatus Nanopelagicales bacterium]|nr:sensor histidine kinase [Candidatus Nanopelagicales bacterium]